MSIPRDPLLPELGKRHGIDAAKGRRSRLAVPLTQLNARGALPPAPALYQQPVVVKVDTPQATAPGVRATYLTQGKGRDGIDAVLYGPGSVDAGAFTARHRQDHHRFTLMVSFPEHGGVDRERFVERFMTHVSHDLGTPLDWMAADHYDTAHPHTHIVLRGVADSGEDLYMKKGYFKHGLRELASALLTQLIGRTQESERQRGEQRTWEPVPVLEQQRQRMAQHTTQAELQRLRTTWDTQRLDGVIRGPLDLDMAQPLPTFNQPGEVYGHEGLAAHVDLLWTHLHRGQTPEQGRGW